jgi:transposase
MTKPPDVEADISRLYYAEHWRVGTIAAQLGIHADVVRRVLGLDRERATGAIVRPRQVDDYRDFIDQTLRQYPRLRATRVYDMVAERGYRGSVRTLREYIATVRPAARPDVPLRLETLPGEQAQVDWAYVGKQPVSGGQRALWVFVIVLSYSRAMWAELVFELTVSSLCRSLVRAAAAFGGLTRQWLFDNPRTIVLERHGAAVRFHPTLLELCGAMRVQPRLCAVARPQQKGRVERSIRYLRERFFAGRTIRSVAHGNEQLLRFFADTAHVRPHPRRPEQSVAEIFAAEEKPRLLALPDPMPPTDTVIPVDVDRCAFVRLDTNLYSAPPAYAERTLTLVADDGSVRLLDGATEVARHPRSFGRHQVCELPVHRDEIIQKRRAATDLKGRDRLRLLVPGIDSLLERWVDAGRNTGTVVVRTLRLLDLYGPDLLAAATADVIARGLSDPAALDAVCERRRKRRALPVPLEMTLPDHITDRDVVPHDLETYDDA